MSQEKYSKSVLKTEKKDSNVDLDNQMSNKDYVLPSKRLIAMLNDIPNGSNREIRHNYDLLPKDIHNINNQIKFSIEIQKKWMNQKNVDKSDNKQVEEDLEETYRKEFMRENDGNDERQICQEKYDMEKDVEGYDDCDGDDEELKASSKEDLEKTEKVNIEVPETGNSNDFVLPSIDSQYGSSESADDKVTVPLEEGSDFIDSRSDSYVCSQEDVKMKTSEQKLNELSSTITSPSVIETDMNIPISSETILTSFSNVDEEAKIWQINLCYNNIFHKEVIKKSPMSMDNRNEVELDIKSKEKKGVDSCISNSPNGLHKQCDGSDETELSHLVGVSTLKRPRGRSGSNNKSRGKRQGGRHRSKRHGNSRGGGKNGGRDSAGGECENANSTCGSAGGSGGDGDKGGDEKREEKKGSEDRPSEEEEDEDNDDDNDENNKVEGEDGAAATSNLLPATVTPLVKTKEKDLTHFLSGNSPQPLQSSEPKGVFKWQIKSESITASSLMQELPDDGGLHSHICMADFCDILGGATGEEYLPVNKTILPINDCLTTLIHKISLASKDDMTIMKCSPCLTLSSLFQHVAKCNMSSNCSICSQGYNLIIHHCKICIETSRLWHPKSRTDLCYKLCENVKWDVTGLLGSNKIYNKTLIKKYCNRVLTLPFDQEITVLDVSINDGQPKMLQEQNSEKQKKSEVQEVEEPVIQPNCDQAAGVRVVSKEDNVQQPEPGQNSFRASGHSYHTNLSRKPSNGRREKIPPVITEEKDEGEKEDNSAEAILRRDYGQKTEDDNTAFNERGRSYSLPQGRIYDQTQFNSVVNRGVGRKGFGEVVYGNINQLKDVAKFWGQKKEECKTSGKLPSQLAEEGVILEKYKHKLRILGPRYQVNYQWHKLTALGSGMNGHCYLARDNETAFKFCVKKISLIDYKEEELCLLSDLNHPNIVTLFGALRHSDTIYLFMEYIDGGDLAHCIDEHKSRGERLSHWLAVKYFQQLLNLLIYLESENLMHEDIKADNLLLRADNFQIILTDFGICHRLQKAVELKNKRPVGTETHFSPEKAASMGHGFPACVWACVCVLVHMLSGQQPWQKYLERVDTLTFTIFIKPPPLDDMPDNIRATVKDLIAQGFIKDPDKRPNARQLLQHEAFNILNQETETYFSTLAPFHSACGITSKASKDKGSAVKDTAMAKVVQTQEEEVSLYEINVDESLKSNDVKKLAMCVERQKNSDTELKGAVGGVVNTEITSKNNLSVIFNIPTTNASSNDTNEVAHLSVEVKEMVDGRVPILEMLLQSSDESTRSFFADTSMNLPMNKNSTLEKFDPNTNNNDVNSENIPYLSIFESGKLYAWNQNLLPMQKDDLSSVSSKPDHSEYNQPHDNTLEKAGYNTLPTSITQKKPSDLKLDVILPKHQSSQEKLTLPRKSNNSLTSSSQSSSVFSSGSSSAIDQENHFRGRFRFNQDENKEQAKEDDEDKKVHRAIAVLRKSIDEDKFDGKKLTIYNEDDEELFCYRISEKDKRLPLKQHVSVIKAKINTDHFELVTMDGQEVDYNKCLKTFELKVRVKENIKQCWCAGCQF